ncbi:MAG: GGDEF domain-containing protein [Lachnospiraceae bacterium]
MKRKTIGVFISGDDDQLQGEFLLGVKKEALKEKCNIVNFHSLINKAIYGSGVTLAESVIAGESSTFSSIDYGQLDGAVIMGDTFISDVIKEKLIEDLIKAGIPIVDVDDQDDRCHCIRYDDSGGMEIMVRHVVEDHGCRKINFISGFKGNRQSEERIDAYKKVLTEYGIPVEEERIGYGEFYTKSVDVMKAMLESNGLPEAVICANDTMALMVINYLVSLGYEIPRDCIITGFDGTTDGQVYIPALTTIKRAIFHSGEKAVEVAMKLIAGKEVDPVIWLEPVLVKNQSCGCMEIDEHPFDNLYHLMNNRINDRDLFNANQIQMTRDFANCKDVWSIIDTAFNYSFFFRVPEMTFCINETVLTPEADCHSDSGSALSENIQDSLYVKRWLSSGEKSEIKKVSAKNFITNHTITSGRPVFFSMVPMYYNERVIGFLMLDQTYCVKELPLLCTWLVSICSTIGNQCLKSEMELLIKKLDNMYVKDSLTNLYNRFGLQREADRLLRYAVRDKRNVFAVEIDLDELKKINDTYGHESGDNAILQVSNAMRYASGNEEILSRIGGDEYFVLGYCDSEKQPDEYINLVHEYLEQYNKDNMLPYTIDCSCGSYISNPNEDDIERIMRIADIHMYKIKMAKKMRKAASKNE